MDKSEIYAKEILTQLFMELSEKIKNCRNSEVVFHYTELLLRIYDRIVEYNNPI